MFEFIFIDFQAKSKLGPEPSERMSTSDINDRQQSNGAGGGGMRVPNLGYPEHLRTASPMNLANHHQQRSNSPPPVPANIFSQSLVDGGRSSHNSGGIGHANNRFFLPSGAVDAAAASQQQLQHHHHQQQQHNMRGGGGLPEAFQRGILPAQQQARENLYSMYMANSTNFGLPATAADQAAAQAAFFAQNSLLHKNNGYDGGAEHNFR